MGIKYVKVEVSATEPTSPDLGSGWIKVIGEASYQEFIYINAQWIPAVGGGTFITETNADDHYRTVVVQEATPDDIIKTGWLWIKESTNQAYLFMFGTYVPYAGA